MEERRLGSVVGLVAAVLGAYGETFPTPTADSFCDTHPQLMTRHALRLFYSPQRRMHPLAKIQFILRVLLRQHEERLALRGPPEHARPNAERPPNCRQALRCSMRR